MSLEQEIKGKALALGFDAVRITDASPLGADHVEHFEAWLRSGCAGRMDYMHRNLAKRIHPAKLLDGAKSVIVVALGYKPPELIADCGPGSESGVTTSRIADSASHDSLPSGTATAVGWAMPTISNGTRETVGTAQGSQTRNTAFGVPHPTRGESAGRVAQYAQYEDYHLFIGSLLRELADFIRAKTDRTERLTVCVDSAPLAEKALAVRAGLGFIGKNHLLIHPQLGPQILLGEVVTPVNLHPDEPIGGSCAGCDRCFKACPTGALRPDSFLDASRCISYLTQYGLQRDSAGRIDNWLFGCDECLLACPFQQNAPMCVNQHFKWYPERAALNPREVLELTAEEFEARFDNSPVRRIGLEMLKHNARRCLKP